MKDEYSYNKYYEDKYKKHFNKLIIRRKTESTASVKKSRSG